MRHPTAIFSDTDQHHSNKSRTVSSDLSNEGSEAGFSGSQFHILAKNGQGSQNEQELRALDASTQLLHVDWKNSPFCYIPARYVIHNKKLHSESGL